ncbi:hypothetical protein NHX12_033359, partial [Muraenolepis orangiensis]
MEVISCVDPQGVRSMSVSGGSEGKHSVATKAEGLDLDLDALGDLQGIPVQGESHEDKPWRKP